MALPELNRKEVHDRVNQLGASDYKRKSDFKTRREAQVKALGLPALPTTTIGSLPQTTEVRNARLRLKKGELTQEQYTQFIQEKIREGQNLPRNFSIFSLMEISPKFRLTYVGIKVQEDLGIDVLVTGEFERNDMVEYFGQHLEGFTFSEKAWVQSFGSRYVKPPIIFGDVSRYDDVIMSKVSS